MNDGDAKRILSYHEEPHHFASPASPRELCCICDDSQCEFISSLPCGHDVRITPEGWFCEECRGGVDYTADPELGAGAETLAAWKRRAPHLHESTCPVSPVPGVHGGMRLQPRGQWNLDIDPEDSLTVWVSPVTDVYAPWLADWRIELRPEIEEWRPPFDFVLMNFYLPPVEPREPDKRPSINHPDDTYDVCHRDVSSWDLR